MSDTTYSHPLPKIDGELVLEVFTHSSLLPGDEDEPTSDEWGGGARLATLGAKVVDLVVMASLFRQQPYLGPTILKVDLY